MENVEAMEEYKAKMAERRTPRLQLDDDCLRWSPLVSSTMLRDEEKMTEKEVSEDASSCILHQQLDFQSFSFIWV